MIKMFIKIPFIIFFLIFFLPFNSYSQKINTYPKIGLTDEEINFLKNNSVFYYAIEVNYAPIEYNGNHNIPKGFGIEYLKKAEELLDIEFKPISNYEKLSWSQCLDALKTGEIDLLPTVSITDERKEYIHFTTPYLTANIVVVGNNDEKLILKEDDFKNSIIVLPNGYWQNEYIKSKIPNINILNTITVIDTLRLINNNRGEYTFLEGTVYNYYRQMAPLRNLKIVGELDLEAIHCIGVTKDKEILRNILNKIIAFIPKDEIYKNAMVIEKPVSDNKLLTTLITISIILIILIVILLKNLFISKKYKKQLQKNKQILIENLSHDLKTPLTSLKISFDLMKRGIITENNHSNQYHSMEKNISTINTIIDDLYNITHMKDYLITRKFTSVNLYDFLKEIYEENVVVFNKNKRTFKFINSLSRDCVMIKIDEDSMSRAINNLLSNSMKFTEENDVITIGYNTLANNQVTIYISDTGIGIDKDHIYNVFDRFYQVNEKNYITGKGLGLSITKEIIEYHKGSIAIDSVKGKYTTFKITLPIK